MGSLVLTMNLSSQVLLLSMLATCHMYRRCQVQSHYPAKCSTTKNQDCVFPFTYKGKTHYKCTYNKDIYDGVAWCATKTDRYGGFINHNWWVPVTVTRTAYMR